MIQYQQHQQQHQQSTHHAHMNQYDQYHQNSYPYSQPSAEPTYSQTRSPSMQTYSDSRQQMNVNHSYMPNHGMCQPTITYSPMEKSTHISQVPTAANDIDNTKFTNAKLEIETTDESDSPVLRALLNNKSAKRLSPNYDQSPQSAKRQRTQAHHYTENGIISPLRTEDSLDYFDDFAFHKQRPITEKSGYEYALDMPLTMTSENLLAFEASTEHVNKTDLKTPLTNHTVSSPITNYVEGISTPPQSPNESAIEQHVNQTSNMCDTSSRTDSQNGSDCKCRITVSFLSQLPELYLTSPFSTQFFSFS